MAIFLGIDGGGSKTSCLIGDENSVLGSGAAAGSNIVRVGEAKAREALAAAIGQACGMAGVTPSRINRTCMGLAGAGQPEIAEIAQRLVSEIVSGEILVVGDTVITLEAAFGSGAGVIVIAGTGSIAYGRNARGETARAGGWGYAVSDEGSGHWIGREAVAAALRWGDQSDGNDSVLMTELMKFWRVETRSELVVAANASPAPDFAALLPAVLAAAASGDTDARNVLARAGGELAALAGVVLHRVFRDDEPVPVAMSGGVFRNSAQVCQAFYNGLRSRATIQTEIVDPVRGALHLARRGG